MWLMALAAAISYYAAVYLTYKILLWLTYRFFSLIAHKHPFRLVLKNTLLLAGIALAVLLPLRFCFDWYGSHMMMEPGEMDRWEDFLLWIGFLPVILFACLSCKIYLRELFTFAGILENDWNWDNPSLELFHISPKNKPEPEERKKRSSDGEGFSLIEFLMGGGTGTISDSEWYDYERSNYDRIYK